MSRTEAGSAGEIRVSRQHPALRGRSGLGVSVAVIDSGVHPSHPHVGEIAGGMAIEEDGERHGDYFDRLGHGTAVTAAIKEKAPNAQIYSIKIFGRTLSTSTGALIQSIDEAVRWGARIVNLSLGTTRAEHELALWACLQRARERGVLVVSPREHEGRAWLPGSLGGAAGVVLDWSCPRDELRVIRSADEEPLFVASGYPRPIPGVSPERNLKGVSFAASNTSGFLACLLEDRVGIDSVQAVVKLFGETSPTVAELDGR